MTFLSMFCIHVRQAACRLFSRGVIFTRARVSHALLSLRKNGGLLVVYETSATCQQLCYSFSVTPSILWVVSMEMNEK